MSGARREQAMLKVTAVNGDSPTLFTLFGRSGGNTQISADEIDSLVSALYSFRAGQHRPGDHRMIERKPVEAVTTRSIGRSFADVLSTDAVPTPKLSESPAPKPGAETVDVRDVVQEPTPIVENTGEGVIAALAPKPKKPRKPRAKSNIGRTLE